MEDTRAEASLKPYVTRGLAVTRAADLRGDQTLEADAVVIGSGAGGAVTAYELARAGKRVVILEAGKYVPSSEFTERLADAAGQLYQDRAAQMNTDGDVNVLQGSCVGGSTVVNGCVCFRTPDFILKEWGESHGLSALASGGLDPHFAKVEERLSIEENTDAEINENSRRLREGAQKLGYSWKPFKRNVKNCMLTGFCGFGCATDRKQSMLVTYLPWAVHEGARLFAETRVTGILAEGGRATGVQAEAVDPKTGQVVSRLQVKARVVVLAAGAVQSPLLLLRSGIANSSGQIGKNFACHPSVTVVGVYPESVHPWRGALAGIHVDQFEALDRGGFLLEGVGFDVATLSVSVEPGVGRFRELLRDAKNCATTIVILHDRNVGEISLDEHGNKQIRYRLSDEDFPNVLKAIAESARIHFAAGATRVLLPTVAPLAVDRPADVDRVLGALRNEPHTFHLVSYHPQGTLRMGADPKRSVVSPTGESHDVKALFVTDASLLPTSIVVNPQVTVYALSSYVAEQILTRHAGYFS